MIPTAITSPTPSTGSVLIVDESDECREVLRTALQRRGYTIHEAQAPDSGLKLAEELSPDVVVLDADGSNSSESNLRDFDFCTAARDRHLVVLGKVSRVEPPSERCHTVSKPYHYAPLILKIESLLQQTQSSESNASDA